MSIFTKAKFLTSAAKLSQLPPDEGLEVAFVGRSNAGKSSALNVLTNQNRLAKISKTPGRTQLINLFELDDERRLVDLPGYGYAKVAKDIKERWQKTLSLYLQKRECLKGLILLADIRHPLKPMDLEMIKWATGVGLHCHLLLTKSDKISFGAAKNSVQKAKNSLSMYGELLTVQSFSALKKEGVEQLESRLLQWFDL